MWTFFSREEDSLQTSKEPKNGALTLHMPTIHKMRVTQVPEFAENSESSPEKKQKATSAAEDNTEEGGKISPEERGRESVWRPHLALSLRDERQDINVRRRKISFARGDRKYVSYSYIVQ